jgi:hypothetical protein
VGGRTPKRYLVTVEASKLIKTNEKEGLREAGIGLNIAE